MSGWNGKDLNELGVKVYLLSQVSEIVEEKVGEPWKGKDSSVSQSQDGRRE